MKVLKRFLSLLLIPLSFVILTGCTNSSDWNAIKNGKEMKIAILVSEEGYEEESTFVAGIKLAIEDAMGKGYKVSYKIFNDENNFDKGVSIAKEIVNNKDYQMAFSFQNMDTFDTISKLFEEGKKPLFSLEGAYDKTMNKGNKYIFNLQSSAENLGIAAGKYAVKKGFKRIAIAHSKGDFELNFIEGFNDSIDKDSNVNVVDSVMGPNKEQEFESVYNRWDILGIDAVVISFEDIDWGMDLIKLIKTKNPNIAIIADPYFNSPTLLKEYAQYVENMVIPSNFPLDATTSLNKFYSDYKSKISTSLTPFVAQGFDLVNIIVEKMQNNASVDEFINAMKSDEEYTGVTKIKFNLNGSFEGDANYITVKNGIRENLKI